MERVMVEIRGGVCEVRQVPEDVVLEIREYDDGECAFDPDMTPEQLADENIEFDDDNTPYVKHLY